MSSLPDRDSPLERSGSVPGLTAPLYDLSKPIGNAAAGDSPSRFWRYRYSFHLAVMMLGLICLLSIAHAMAGSVVRWLRHSRVGDATGQSGPIWQGERA